MVQNYRFSARLRWQLPVKKKKGGRVGKITPEHGYGSRAASGTSQTNPNTGYRAYFLFVLQNMHGVSQLNQLKTSIRGGTHMLKHTGMYCPNGLVFHQKILRQGSHLRPKNP